MRASHDVPTPVDTVTVYMSSERSGALADEVVALRPRRVIFNPGAENDVLAASLPQHGGEVVEACTLVLLRTGQF